MRRQHEDKSAFNRTPAAWNGWNAAKSLARIRRALDAVHRPEGL